MHIDMSYEDFFSVRLSRLRENKGVSARDMSLSLGNDPSYINIIENKKAFPSMRQFFAICEYLRITPEQFFRQDIEYPARLEELLAIYPHLDSESTLLLLEFARKMEKG